MKLKKILPKFCMTRVSDCLAGFLIAAADELIDWSMALSVSCRPFGGRERPAWPPMDKHKRKKCKNGEEEEEEEKNRRKMYKFTRSQVKEKEKKQKKKTKEGRNNTKKEEIVE